LSFVKSFQRHQIRGQRLDIRCQRTIGRYVFRASSIRSMLSLPEPTKVKRMVI
jgi:hypothetical protein